MLPAWHDDDDDDVAVDLTHSRLRKLRSHSQETHISGSALSERMRERSAGTAPEWMRMPWEQEAREPAASAADDSQRPLVAGSAIDAILNSGEAMFARRWGDEEAGADPHRRLGPLFVESEEGDIFVNSHQSSTPSPIGCASPTPDPKSFDFYKLAPIPQSQLRASMFGAATT